MTNSTSDDKRHENNATRRRLYSLIVLAAAVFGLAAGVLGVLAFQNFAQRRKSPDKTVDENVTRAKEFLEKGDTETAIACLGAALAVDGATNKDEARRLLNDTVVSRLAKNTLLERFVNSKSPPPPLVEPKSDWTIEELIRAYSQAPTWRHKLPFVVDQEKAQPIMAEHYSSAYQPAASFTIKPLTATDIKVGETIRVIVDRPGKPSLPVLIVRTAQGYRIDWLASRTLWLAEEDANYRKAHGLVDARLDIEVLMVKQSSVYATITARVTNRSDAHLTYWGLDCEVYDKDNKYLAHATGNGTNLAPGGSKIEDFLFNDTLAIDIKSWKFKIGDVSIDVGGGIRTNATKMFVVTEKK